MTMTDKQVIRYQAEVNKHMRDTLVRIRDRCHNSVEFSKTHGHRISRVAQDVLEECQDELTYLDSRGADLDAKVVGTEQSQMKLMHGYQTPKVKR